MFQKHHLSRDALVVVAGRSSLIASDLVVCGVTWYQTYVTAKVALYSHHKKTLSTILFVNGAYIGPAILTWRAIKQFLQIILRNDLLLVSGICQLRLDQRPHL